MTIIKIQPELTPAEIQAKKQLIEKQKTILKTADVPSQVKEFAAALIDSELLRDIKATELSDILIDALTTANMIGGWKPKETDEYQTMSNVLRRDLSNKYGFLTKKELMLCLQMGAKGELLETVGLSVNVCLKWLESFVTRANRRLAKEILLKAPKVEPPVLTDEDRRAFANQAYQKYLASNGDPERREYDDLGNIVYDFLDKSHLINFTVEEKKGFFNQAKFLQAAAAQKAKTALNSKDTVRVIAEINSIGTEEETPAAEAARKLVIIASKKLALNRFFYMADFAGDPEIYFFIEPLDTE